MSTTKVVSSSWATPPLAISTLRIGSQEQFYVTMTWKQGTNVNYENQNYSIFLNVCKHFFPYCNGDHKLSLVTMYVHQKVKKYKYDVTLKPCIIILSLHSSTNNKKTTITIFIEIITLIIRRRWTFLPIDDLFFSIAACASSCVAKSTSTCPLKEPLSYSIHTLTGLRGMKNCLTSLSLAAYGSPRMWTVWPVLDIIPKLPPPPPPLPWRNPPLPDDPLPPRPLRPPPPRPPPYPLKSPP